LDQLVQRRTEPARFVVGRQNDAVARKDHAREFIGAPGVSYKSRERMGVRAGSGAR
jgi:hypothetical protein